MKKARVKSEETAGQPKAQRITAQTGAEVRDSRTYYNSTIPPYPRGATRGDFLSGQQHPLFHVGRCVRGGPNLQDFSNPIRLSRLLRNKDFGNSAPGMNHCRICGPRWYAVQITNELP